MTERDGQRLLFSSLGRQQGSRLRSYELRGAVRLRGGGRASPRALVLGGGTQGGFLGSWISRPSWPVSRNSGEPAGSGCGVIRERWVCWARSTNASDHPTTAVACARAPRRTCLIRAARYRAVPSEPSRRTAGQSPASRPCPTGYNATGSRCPVQLWSHRRADGDSRRHDRRTARGIHYPRRAARAPYCGPAYAPCAGPLCEHAPERGAPMRPRDGSRMGTRAPAA